MWMEQLEPRCSRWDFMDDEDAEYLEKRMQDVADDDASSRADDCDCDRNYYDVYI